jgi:hypothetical protein
MIAEFSFGPNPTAALRTELVFFQVYLLIFQPEFGV